MRRYTSEFMISLLRDGQQRGMTISQLSAETGIPQPTLHARARRHGIKLRDGRPELARQQMKARWADSEWRAKQAERARKVLRDRLADPAINPLAALDPVQREVYDLYKRKGFSRPEAFEAIGLPRDFAG